MKLRSLLIRKAVSALATLCLWGAALLVILPLLVIFWHIVRTGAETLTPAFFTNIPQPTGVPGGGMANGIAGSALMIAMAALAGIPIGISGAVYLNESGTGRLATMIRFCADVLAGIPSIITGMVVYSLLVVPMKGFSAIAGACALTLIMIPIVLRTTEEQLRLVPASLREAALALGVPLWRTTLKVTLRSAMAGVTTGVLLATARIAGETAPLLFTALGNQFWSRRLTEPMAALPLQIFNFAISPYEDWHKLAWSGALVLVGIMFSLSLGARWLGRRTY